MRIAAGDMALIRALTAAAVLIIAAAAAIAQQPCNPVIDGTYCAEQPIRPRPARPAPPPPAYMPPIQSIGRDMFPDDKPGTLGAITFQYGPQCIGLLRRGVCK
jgi:hypothetical protein